MFWKRLRPVLIAIAAVFLAAPVSAQMGAQDLPDLSGIASAIEKSVSAPPAPPKGKLFQSGLPVPSVNPGETARDIGRQLREATERQTGPNPAMQKLEAGMPQLLSGLEAQIETKGFAKRDLGVASGVFFTETWQTATKQNLSDPAEAAAVRAVAEAAATRYKARYAALLPAAREKTYESLLVSTALMSIFAQTFDKAGKTQEAAGIRQTAGALFTKVVGVPPSQVHISADGRITDAAPEGAVPAPPPQAPAPHSGRAARAVRASRFGMGVKPSQIAGVYAQQINEIGAGGFVSVGFEPVLALKDGTYCEDFDVPPSEFDAAASRRSHPQHWGRWRGSGKHIKILSDKGVWEDAVWTGPLSGGGPGQHLSGTFTAIGGGGNTAFGGDTAVAVEKSFTFFPDGRFRAGSSASASTGNAVASSGQETSGTYTLGGYALTMRFRDGTVRRWSYARMADGPLYLNGESYLNWDHK